MRDRDGQEIFTGQGQEFEARNRQLPADLGSAVTGDSPLEDIRQQAAQTRLGTPPQDCDVRSTFDSRPVNAYDFNLIGTDPAPN